MIRKHKKKKIAIAVLSVLMALLAGCTTYYKFPADSDPNALLKIRFSFGEYDPAGYLITAYLRLSNESGGGKLGLAFEDDGMGGFQRGLTHVPFLGNFFDRRSNPLRMEVIKIKPGKDIYLWATMSKVTKGGETTTIERCPVTMKFNPAAKKMYVFIYKTKDLSKGCAAALYEEKPNGHGGFDLVETGEFVNTRSDER